MLLSFDQILHTIDDAIKSLVFDGRPQGLYEPVSYTLACGGKRIRPALLLIVCDLYGGQIKNALSPALGMEVFHNFTLLHDDLMDEADIRRNRPTVHSKWNNNTAILSGDAMLISAYRLIGETPEPFLREILPLFTRTALEICEGQQFDMEFESRTDVAEDEYIEMIRLKTAVLPACCCQAGAIIGGAPAAEAEQFYRFGLNMGLAFQLQDDLLDVYGNPQTFGKNIGGDILCNKKTFLLINATQRASERQNAIMARYRNADGAYSPTEKIATFTSIYDELGIKALTEERILHYYNKAMDDLKSLSLSPVQLTVLYEACQRLMSRES